MQVNLIVTGHFLSAASHYLDILRDRIERDVVTSIILLNEDHHLHAQCRIGKLQEGDLFYAGKA